MKFFTNRGVTKKIVIVILTVLLLTFAVPKPVNAAGGILLGPLTALCTTLVDSLQHILERFMLGEWNSFMKNIDDTSSYNSQEGGAATVDLDEEGIEIGGAWWGDVTGTEIPVIQYTPEEIFSNRVPALDVNFIKPSVTTGNTTWDNEHNIAMKLRPTIASWYVAMRTLALVGLLSVLVYLGIRMLLTSVAADKAKYKKMMMDWVVAICLLFALHYIMSFALTMSEVVTSMIANTSTGTITVKFGEHTFTGNLMSYVRFMIQAKDTSTSLGFFFLYIMLMIYTVKFTWVYLKRVVNMAFLTLIAPLVALTYPIDKVSDAKAQAFELWVKEFTFNALLQPLHLLLYIVLLGSATELVAVNPLYAVVCLGFITAGEKLFKKMFGFDKAGAGTVGSLAGAAGVSALAHSALMKLGKGPHGGKGGAPGKVRTNDRTQREGRDPNANKGFQSFDKEGNQGLNELESNGDQAQLPSGSGDDGGQVPPPDGNNGGGQVPPPDGDNGGELPPPNGDDTQLPSESNEEEQVMSIDDQIAQERANMSVQDYRESGMSPQEWEANRREELEAERANNHKEQQDGTDMPEEQSPQGTPEVQEAMRNLGPEESEPTFFGTMGNDTKNFVGRVGNRLGQAKEFGGKLWHKDSRKEIIAKGKKKTITGIRKNAIAAWKAVPTVIYKGLRGTAKTAARVALGTAIGATAGVIGATTGDGETALKWMAGGFGVGAATGGSAFEGTVGKFARDKKVRDKFDEAKYGSAIDARNARADKAYLKSDEHKDEYDKYWKGKMDRKEYDKAVKEYRQAGITDKKIIRNALKLEQQYKDDKTRNHGSVEDIRGKVQNIVQTYDNVDKKAVYGSDVKATEATLKNLEKQMVHGDAKQKRAIANEILQGYRDWYNI